MVILEPQAKVGSWDIGLVKDDNFSNALSLQAALLNLIVSVLGRVSQDWAELVDELSTFLGHDDTFLHPEQHDRLLWDDEEYSRSKKYFWCLSTLQPFETNIGKNRKYWFGFRDALYLPLLEALQCEGPSEPDLNAWSNVPEEVKLLKSGIAEADRICNCLEAEVERLKHIREVATMMRDGVCSHLSIGAHGHLLTTTDIAIKRKFPQGSSGFDAAFGACQTSYLRQHILFTAVFLYGRSTGLSSILHDAKG